MFTAMKYDETGCLKLLDQRALPGKELWLDVRDIETAARAIEDMVVRGAPAIGCAAAWGLAVDTWQHSKSYTFKTWSQYQPTFQASVERLARTRPTAVNLFYALAAMKKIADTFAADLTMDQVTDQLVHQAKVLEIDDVRTCRAIGSHGADMFKGRGAINVLTHCNTGSLATAGYGTALGIVRALHERSQIKSVFVDETRPYLQGSRLTAFELSQEKIPYKLITDNMAAYAMQHGWVDLVVVGADRIASNGDTANKIGTYGLAVLCKHHNVPFVVAAPKATIDTKMPHGRDIPVEQRHPREVKEVHGILIAPHDAEVWNPSFDVTPNDLITAIVTEDGVFKGKYDFR